MGAGPARVYVGKDIFERGGLTESDIVAYGGDIVDAFGVGGAIANAPVIDFSMDIVERNGGEPVSKRGKKGGVKQVYLTEEGERLLLPASSESPSGGGRALIILH